MFASLLAAVDLADVVTAIVAISALFAAVNVAKAGARRVLGMIK
jgi:hypothetical protein